MSFRRHHKPSEEHKKSTNKKCHDIQIAATLCATKVATTRTIIKYNQILKKSKLCSAICPSGFWQPKLSRFVMNPSSAISIPQRDANGRSHIYFFHSVCLSLSLVDSRPTRRVFDDTDSQIQSPESLIGAVSSTASVCNRGCFRTKVLRPISQSHTGLVDTQISS